MILIFYFTSLNFFLLNSILFNSLFHCLESHKIFIIPKLILPLLLAFLLTQAIPFFQRFDFLKKSQTNLTFRPPSQLPRPQSKFPTLAPIFIRVARRMNAIPFCQIFPLVLQLLSRVSMVQGGNIVGVARLGASIQGVHVLEVVSDLHKPRNLLVESLVSHSIHFHDAGGRFWG